MNFRKTSLESLGVLALSSLMPVSAAGDISLNGYLNIIGSISDSEAEYREDISENSTFSSTNFGLVATKRISSKLSVAGQLHGQGALFDFGWGYATYLVNSDWTAKAGKIKYPATLLSEVIDIGVTYPWVQPPVAVYGTAAGMSFKAYTGGSIAYTAGDETEFSSEFYMGETNDLDSNHKKMLGVVMSATSENVRAQVGVNTSVMEFEDPAAPNAALMGGRDMTIYNLGIKAEYELLTIYYEYGKTVMSGLSLMDREGWYLSVIHPMETWTPHLTYQSYLGMSDIEETGLIIGLNKMLDLSTVVKFDIQQIEPVNGGFFEVQPDNNKVYLLNVSLNMVF